MNILFLVSANKTIIFEEVSKRLENDGYSTYWITPSQYWNDWLQSQGVSHNHILNLPDKVKTLRKGPLDVGEIKRISDIEGTANIAFSDLFFMDRVLREKDYHYAFRYMLMCFDEITSFIEENQINNVFSEQTWNFEIITSIVCGMAGVNSYYVDGVKVPDGEGVGRFAFFEGYLLNRLPKYAEPKKNDFEFASKLLEEYRKNKEGTSYLKSFFYEPSIKLNWVSKFIKHVNYLLFDKFDFTRRSLFLLVNFRLMQVFNHLVLSIVNPFIGAGSIDSTRYILIALHKQPDSAVDVAASAFLNQFEAINTLIRKVPLNYDVVIKDHSHALGINSLTKYKSLLKNPRVMLADPRSDTFKLIENAQLVYSLGGTISLEAALMGKRSLTAVEKFFSDVTMRKSVNPYQISTYEIKQILNEEPPSNEKLIKYLATVHANSYLGMVLDPTANKIYAAEDNINNIYQGFKDFLHGGICE